MLTHQSKAYYRGGRYDFPASTPRENIDPRNKWPLVFEIDSIKENRELFPAVVTTTIMEAFINKDTALKG